MLHCCGVQIIYASNSLLLFIETVNLNINNNRNHTSKLESLSSPHCSCQPPRIVIIINCWISNNVPSGSALSIQGGSRPCRCCSAKLPPMMMVMVVMIPSGRGGPSRRRPSPGWIKRAGLRTSWVRIVLPVLVAMTVTMMGAMSMTLMVATTVSIITSVNMVMRVSIRHLAVCGRRRWDVVEKVLRSFPPHPLQFQSLRPLDVHPDPFKTLREKPVPEEEKAEGAVDPPGQGLVGENHFELLPDPHDSNYLQSFDRDPKAEE